MNIFNPYRFGEVGLGYGYLYNVYSIADAKFAPTGWHVPTDTELVTLFDGQGGLLSGGAPLKETGTVYWLDDEGTNTSGFSAYGSGLRDAAGAFQNIKQQSWLWSTTVFGSGYNYSYYLSSVNSIITQQIARNHGLSVRLIKDDSTDPLTMTDEDGNVYDTVKLGSQVWTVQNWKCTKFNDNSSMTIVTGNTAWAGLTTEGYCAYLNNENNV